jgi:hypothetical protein
VMDGNDAPSWKMVLQNGFAKADKQ